MAKYEKLVDGEGTTIPNGKMFRLACCDCHLVHDVVIYTSALRKGQEIGLAVRRNPRSTAAKRRRNTRTLGA